MPKEKNLNINHLRKQEVSKNGHFAHSRTRKRKKKAKPSPPASSVKSGKKTVSTLENTVSTLENTVSTLENSIGTLEKTEVLTVFGALSPRDEKVSVVAFCSSYTKLT